MSLPVELQKLPPQALDVIRFLDGKDGGAPINAILAGTGLNERALGKAIRRLVTRYYAEMPTQGVYVLTKLGRQAAQDLRAFDGAALASSASAAAPDDTQTPRHARRLSLLMAQELVVRVPSKLMVGFDAPSAETTPLVRPARMIVRISAPGCDVQPVERPLEVGVGGAAGPVQFRLIPRREGTVRVKLEAFQLVTPQELRPVGGMYFDVPANPFPTAKSAELQALGALVYLYASDES